MQAVEFGLEFLDLHLGARAAVLAFMGQAATDPVASNDAYVSWRFPYLIALILDSVYHTMR